MDGHGVLVQLVPHPFPEQRKWQDEAVDDDEEAAHEQVEQGRSLGHQQEDDERDVDDRDEDKAPERGVPRLMRFEKRRHGARKDVRMCPNKPSFGDAKVEHDVPCDSATTEDRCI